MGWLLALVRTLGPIAAILIGTAGGGSIAAAGFWAWNTFIDNPQLVTLTKATAEAECKIKVLEAATAAEAAERARQQAIADRTLRAYQEAEAARHAAEQQRQELLEQEIADYETKLTNEGRQCLLDGSDVDWLRGQRVDRAGVAAGSR